MIKRKPSKPKIVGREDDDDGEVNTIHTQGPKINAKIVSITGGDKPMSRKTGTKVTSKLKVSLASLDATEEEQHSEAFQPKRSAFSQKLREGLGTDLTLPSNLKQADISRTYSSDYLSQLRDSTPSTPREYVSDGQLLSDPTHMEGTKPGDAVNLSQRLHIQEIPEQGAISHFKEQRSIRKAGGEQYVSLSDSLENRVNDTRSRLQTEDEVDLIGRTGNEGFEEYVEDDIVLGHVAERTQADRKRQDMAQVINEVEEGMDESDTEDEWENTQIRKSAPANAIRHNRKLGGIVPTQVIPTPKEIRDRLLQAIQTLRAKQIQTKEILLELDKEEVEIAEREELVRIGLVKASEEYERLRTNMDGLNYRTGGLDDLGNR